MKKVNDPKRRPRPHAVNIVNAFNDIPDRTEELQKERLIRAQEESNRIKREEIRTQGILAQKKDIQNLQLKNNSIAIDNLLSVIPNTKKYKVHRRMAKRFSKHSIVPNYILASCIKPTVLSNKKTRKLSKNDYNLKKDGYNERIKGRLVIIKRLLHPLGFTIKFNANETQVIPIS